MTTRAHRSLRIPLAPLAALLLLAGCGDVLKQPYPAKAFYAIEPGVPDVSAAAPSPAVAPGTYINANGNAVATTRPTDGGVMLVRPVRVSPPYDGLAFVYANGAAQYDADYYVNWIAPPSALLTGGLVDWLDRSGPLPVVAAGSSVRPTVTLDGEVTRLLIDRTDRARPRAVLAARFFLTTESRSGIAILLDGTYSAQVTTAGDTPAAHAAAWGQAYRQVLKRLADDLRSAVARPG